MLLQAGIEGQRRHTSQGFQVPWVVEGGGGVDKQPLAMESGGAMLEVLAGVGGFGVFRS